MRVVKKGGKRTKAGQNTFKMKENSNDTNQKYLGASQEGMKPKLND